MWGRERQDPPQYLFSPPRENTGPLPARLAYMRPLTQVLATSSRQTCQAGSFVPQASAFLASCLLPKPYTPFRVCSHHGWEGESFPFSEPPFPHP